MAWAGLLISWLTGWWLVRWIWGPVAARRSPLLLQVCLALPLGLGVSAAIFCIWLYNQPWSAYWLLGLDVVGAIIARWLMRQRLHSIEARQLAAQTPGRAPALRRVGEFLHGLRTGDFEQVATGIFVLALLAATVLAALVLAADARAYPLGTVEAWSTTGIHARFFATAGAHWADAYGSALAWAHPEQPLLWPLVVARLWVYGDPNAAWIPAALSWGLVVLLVGLVASAVLALRGITLGVLAGLTLLSAPLCFAHGATQTTDLLTAVFLVGAVACLALGPAYEDDGAWPTALAGAMAGLAAWTTAGGLWYAALLTLTLLVAAMVTSVSPRQMPPVFLMIFWVLGLVLPLTLVLVTKMDWSDVLDPFTNLSTRWPTAERARRVAAQAGQTLTHGAAGGRPLVDPLVLLLAAASAALLGLNRARPWRMPWGAGTAALVLFVAGYAGACLLQPLAPAADPLAALPAVWWHAWPAAVFLLFAALRSPAEALRG